MPHRDEKNMWEKYRDEELALVTPILLDLGFLLDKNQPHIGGERFLMTDQKLVLLGRRINDNNRMIIKIGTGVAGIKELQRERSCRQALKKLKFAYKNILLPNELLFAQKKQRIIFITEYIKEALPFLKHSLQDQFDMILQSFKSQEGLHATTYAHIRSVQKVFGTTNAQQYIDTFAVFRQNIVTALPQEEGLGATLDVAERLLRQNHETIERYTLFFTHTDFVPHNFRVVQKNIYLLDNTSFRFGNKHEGWARLINYMLLYNPQLMRSLDEYVKHNRSEEEYASLRLMRIYKIGRLLKYHSSTLAKTTTNLNLLSRERIALWTYILQSILNNESINPKIIEQYKEKRDTLRSENEKERQREIGQL